MYAYDPRGNLTNATTLDPGLSNLDFSVMSYDAADRLTNITSAGGRWLSFTYDSAGRRASSLDQLGHRLTYSYDVAGRLESMTNELGQWAVRYDYDAAGRLARKALGNGMVATYGYDAAGQLLTLTNRLADGTAISWFNYAYDTRGRRTAMATHYGAWAYDYDDLGQLTRAVLNSTDPQIPSQDLAYVYDALGNRIRTIENGVTTEYTANSLNQYVRVGQTNYVFDLDGNLIQEITPQGTNTFVYNDENRLIAVSQGADTWEYLYDALGNRVATTENGVAKRFVIDPIGLGNVVGQYDALGNLLAHYDHGLGLLSRTDAGGNPAYYTFDAIGNVQQLVTAAGAVANAYAYAPFGALMKRTEAIPNPFQFVGKFGVLKEGNGLNFMRARFYEPVTGRFVTEDPVGLDPHSINLYRYVLNSPTRAVDPRGLEGLSSEDWPTGLNPLTDPEHPHYHDDYYEQLRKELGIDDQRPLSEQIREDPNLNRLEAFEFWYNVFQAGTLQGPPPTPGVPGIVELLRKMLSDALQNLEDVLSGVSRSTDPNAKTGPTGFGTNGFITASGTLAYRIDFENETNASAPAQQVVITDQLSGNLDWSPFRLAEVGFGDQLIVVPPNSQHFETNVPVSYLGTNFQVQIEAGLQVFSGLVYANFRSIDPATSLPPPVNIGFLPPEDGTGRGMGHIAYTISAKPNLPTGAQIRNVALISFDLLPGIATNQRDPHNPGAGTGPAKECLNTIDAGPPTSQVLPLSETNSAAVFQVEWTGQDDPGGSGIANYDLYFSDNSGPWVLWQSGIVTANAKFTGRSGHRYQFYSVARDHVGHSESKLPTVEAETYIQANTAPMLAAIADQWVDEGTALVVTNEAADADIPANVLTYGLAAAPAGTSIDPTTGVLTWMPTEAQGPSTNLITVRVVDSGSPPLSATQRFTVVVREVNNAPVLGAIPSLSVNAGTLLTYINIALDGDWPANALTYSLPVGPRGAIIDPRTGVFIWQAASDQAGSSYLIIVRVTDNGSPPLSASQSFVITVNQPSLAARLSLLPQSNGQFAIQIDGNPGLKYGLEYSTNLANSAHWTPLLSTNAAATPFILIDTNLPTPQRFYRLSIGP